MRWHKEPMRDIWDECASCRPALQDPSTHTRARTRLLLTGPRGHPAYRKTARRVNPARGQHPERVALDCTAKRRAVLFCVCACRVVCPRRWLRPYYERQLSAGVLKYTLPPAFWCRR